MILEKLTYDSDRFYLGGRPFPVYSGDLHYFRVHPSDWARRLKFMKDFGLTCVQTYVPWNAHEPRKGQFCFDGMLNLSAFLTECEKAGLYVLLRPSPYICSEWDLGGLPWWLLKEDMVLRSRDERYLRHVRDYYRRLIPEFLPHLSTRGGCVIAVAVENEYGSYGYDEAYPDALAEMLVSGRVDVPLYTTDGDWETAQRAGRIQKYPSFTGVNYRAKAGNTAHAMESQKKMRPDVPFFAGELWTGRSMHWGEPFYHRDPREAASAVKEILNAGGNLDFYMFSGGSNFGFMPGANYGRSYSPREGTLPRYIPHMTSYEEDAVLDEAGNPTPKYELCRIRKGTGAPETRRAQALSVPLSQTAGLFENLDALTRKTAVSAAPVSIEDMDFGYGLMLYSFDLPAGPKVLEPEGVRDRANVYVDGAFRYTHIRDRGLTFAAPGAKDPAAVGRDASRAQVLTESLGRINFGPLIPREKKGLDALKVNGLYRYGCESRVLPLDDLSVLEWKESPHPAPLLPVFRRGFFDAEAGVDSYVCTRGFSRGYVWINGFLLGRYDCAGPQYTLYLPGALLKEKHNELIVLDLRPETEADFAELLDHAIIEGEAGELS